MTQASTPKTEIWDKLARPDPKALKAFQRSGGFRGTAINPMHTLHTVTEVLGPCGKGWGMTKPDFQVIGNNVYCTVGVWHGETAEFHDKYVWGVGGETMSGRGDDEAFKKAYTDALGNALKHLGANADIYFNLWDGNKYVDEKREPISPHEDPPQNTGPQLLKRDEARKLYKELQSELVTLATVSEVSKWEKARLLDIQKLGDWRTYIDKEISAHLEYIQTAREAAE